MRFGALEYLSAPNPESVPVRRAQLHLRSGFTRAERMAEQSRASGPATS